MPQVAANFGDSVTIGIRGKVRNNRLVSVPKQGNHSDDGGGVTVGEMSSRALTMSVQRSTKRYCLYRSTPEYRQHAGMRYCWKKELSSNRGSVDAVACPQPSRLL